MAGETFVSGLASTLRIPRQDEDRMVQSMLQASLQRKLMEEQQAWRNEQMKQQGLTQERGDWEGTKQAFYEKLQSLRNPKTGLIPTKKLKEFEMIKDEYNRAARVKDYQYYNPKGFNETFGEFDVQRPKDRGQSPFAAIGKAIEKAVEPKPMEPGIKNVVDKVKKDAEDFEKKIRGMLSARKKVAEE